MNSIIILGASSFLGKVFLKNAISDLSFKAIVRKIPEDADKYDKKIKWIKLDDFNFSSLIKIFEKGDIVINLTYIKDNNINANINLINHIVDACIYSKISRLIHCSTVSVVGDNDTNIVNELTLCKPKTPYEKVKMEVEKIVLSGLSKGIDIAILRPTAIVGYGGKNLLKLSNSLMYGNKFINYLKRCILADMPMHLIPVRNVVSALMHLALLENNLNGNIFLVSDDRDINNNFSNVEEILLDALELENTKFPRIFIPKIFQSALFKIFKRNDLNPNRVYVSKKITDYGFKPIDTVKDAIYQFSKSIKKGPN